MFLLNRINSRRVQRLPMKRQTIVDSDRVTPRAHPFCITGHRLHAHPPGPAYPRHDLSVKNAISSRLLASASFLMPPSVASRCRHQAFERCQCVAHLARIFRVEVLQICKLERTIRRLVYDLRECPSCGAGHPAGLLKQSAA